MDYNVICFTFPKMVSRKILSEPRIFASCEKRLCHLLAENVLVWCGSDGMMESFGETGKVLLRFIQRASLAISCVSSPTRANSFLAQFSSPSRQRTVKTQSSRTFEVVLVNTFLHATIERSTTDEILSDKKMPRVRRQKIFEYASFFQKSKPT